MIRRRFGRRDTGYTAVVVNVRVVVAGRRRQVEGGERLTNYFLLSSVQHYLVVDTTKKLVLHYVRGPEGRPIMHAPTTEGDVHLNPPGLALSLNEIFG